MGMKGLKGFVRYVPQDRLPSHTRGQRTGISTLEVGEMWFLPQKKDNRLYQRIYALQKRSGKEFDYMEINNGIVIRRIK